MKASYLADKLTRRVTAVLMSLLLLAQAMPAANPGGEFPPPHSTIFLSRDQDVELGRQAAQQARQQFPIISDSDPVAQYVRRLGQSMVQYVPEPRYPYEFHVVNDKAINAFALPGGPVFVNIGSIQAADNEAELAGVIAHEMGHVYMRHGAMMASNQLKASMALGVLGAIVGRGVGGQLAQMGGQLFASGALLHNSRTAESEADAVGARIMYMAGYNPRALSEFFRKLEQEGGARGPQMLSDHPDPGNRAQAIDDLIRTLPRRSFNGSTGQFQQVKQMLTGGRRGQLGEPEMMPQQRPGEGGAISGISRSDIQPSGQFQRFDHQAFTLGYPNNWQVMGDASSAITIAPPAGVTQNAVAYGVIISGFDAEAQDLDSATHELVQSLRQSNPDLRMIGHDENIRVNGVAGKSVELMGTSPVQGQRERNWLVVVPSRQSGLLYLVFIAPEQDFGALRPTYESMLRSFRLK